jgi:TetR/AcrR family transcriptional regulator, regulator of cefoperazone and chloramphenicol sensitivity
VSRQASAPSSAPFRLSCTPTPNVESNSSPHRYGTVACRDRHGRRSCGDLDPMATPRPAPRRPPGGSQERADRTRALVIEETVRCIIEEGYAAASARHIAERAGVTWGGIQYHFGDREALMMAVVDEGFSHLLECLRAGPETASAPRSIRRMAESIVSTAWEAFSTPTSMAALEILIATRASRDPAATEHLTELAEALSKLGRQIGQGLRSTHATAIGNLLWSALRGMVLAQMVVSTPVDTTRERRELIDVIVTYIERHQKT